MDNNAYVTDDTRVIEVMSDQMNDLAEKGAVSLADGYIAINAPLGKVTHPLNLFCWKSFWMWTTICLSLLS